MQLVDEVGVPLRDADRVLGKEVVVVGLQSLVLEPPFLPLSLAEPVVAFAVLLEERNRDFLPNAHAIPAVRLEFDRRDVEAVPVSPIEKRPGCAPRDRDVVPRALGLEALELEPHRVVVEQGTLLGAELPLIRFLRRPARQPRC